MKPSLVESRHYRAMMNIIKLIMDAIGADRLLLRRTCGDENKMTPTPEPRNRIAKKWPFD